MADRTTAVFEARGVTKVYRMGAVDVRRWNPSQGRYSPLWDVHLAA